MAFFSRREFVALSLAASAGLARAAGPAVKADFKDVHEQILQLAARQEAERRARFAAVKSQADLHGLQKDLRESFLRLIGGFPEAHGLPAVTKLGRIEADDYLIEKLAYESLPGYFVSALLYKPKKISSALPGVISPCGHSATGKAADSYQMLHINLAKRGYVVLTYDPVGQGERSQFWDAAKGKSRFGLGCGEHAVLGNPLYLLGGSLARYRIFDGMRAIDYLSSLEEVDSKKIGCAGNSGGGTLTAYIAALDPRVAAAAICCYITTLPRRMGNRIQADPDADPEQDVFGFVSEGIDHAGLLALIAPRPLLLGTARFDFFPIEGARESFAEGRRLYEVAEVSEQVERVEAIEKHGLSLPIREGIYRWFDRWLAGRGDGTIATEIPVRPRPASELLVCAEGQVNRTLRSRPLLPLAWEEFNRSKKPPRLSLKELLVLDPGTADPTITEISPGDQQGGTIVICVGGNETSDWREEKTFLQELADQGAAVLIVDPRGAGSRRVNLSVKGHEYADPLAGTEENIAYNAFLVGKSLLGMRVTDVQAAVQRIATMRKPQRLVLCGRRDAALVACLAAAVERSVTHLAGEEMLLSFLPLFAVDGQPINAASILPGLLRSFGDLADALDEIAPRPVFMAAGAGDLPRRLSHVSVSEQRFTQDPKRLTDWMKRQTDAGHDARGDSPVFNTKVCK